MRSILITTTSDEALNEQLAAAVAEIPDIEVVRVFKEYPAMDQLLRSIRLNKPDFLFLSGRDLDQAELLAAGVDNLMLELPIVVFGDRLDSPLVLRLMHLGVREYLTPPFDRAMLVRLRDFISKLSKKHPPVVARLADLYTFLPAKPGVGNSTLAVSTSCALADDFGTRTLLMDGDVHAGVVKFLLKLGDSASILDAVAHAQNLDDDIWSKMVGHWDKLDVLHAGELSSRPDINLQGLHRVLDVARAQYDVICVDLPSSLEPVSVELMEESRRIFMVTTPEVVALHLAAERFRALTKLGLADRVSLLLNRKPGRTRTLTEEEVETAVGLPVSHTFSNDYDGVGRTILQGGPISHNSPLGESILDLARGLVPERVPRQPTSKSRRFLEFFHVPVDAEPAHALRD